MEDMMSMRRFCFLLLFTLLLALLTWIPTNSQVAERNVNMVEGQTLPGGDPWLQRQNEPSIAVSTRNPLHLLAGANDYRTVEIPILGEELPGLPEGAAAGDAWLGVFKSFDGGESWMSTLLPGYPQDTSFEGTSSPLYGFQAAADPTVRSGPNGLFYYSGIAFDRIEHGRSAVFVARYIDNNNIEDPDPLNDPIEYIDTKIIDEGTSGQFADKPWIAVDIPRNGGTVEVDGQYIPRHSVYIVYSLFLGDLAVDVHNKILFARSLDCGNTWEHPIKLSESQRINQGTTLAVDPKNGDIYVAWRRFASEGEPDAIMFCKSTDGGRKFNKATVVAEIEPFDQGTTETSFRTNAYPTIAVDNKNNVYLAWSERVGPMGDNLRDARIVIVSGKNGHNWSSRELVDDYAGRGHQIMPSLTFAAGKLMIAWYDFRKDVAGEDCGFEDYISDDHDPLFCNFRHTVDVRLAEASAGMNPGFNDSVQVSRYYWIMENDGTCYQAQFNPPNYPLFKQGTVPFIGDYIDICPSPMFVLGGGDWRFNTEPSDPSIFHVTWTDNRDVRPPPDGNWTIYNPPNSSQPGFPTPAPCSAPDRTGMRNQNIYTSRIIPGIEASSPGNTKLLDIQRTFVICVKNTTAEIKSFLLMIANQPPGGKASFVQSGSVVDELPVDIAPFSSISRPVFIESSVPDASVRIEVQEIDGGLQSYIVLNPDPTNPEVDPGDEDHTPIVESIPVEVNLVNANLVNANLVNQNIPQANLVNANLVNFNFLDANLVNANLVNANLVNFTVYDSANLVNANLVNSSVEAPVAVTDVQWTVTNDGNTTTSYTFRSIAPESLPEGLYAQLIIYQAHTTPGTDGNNCALKEVPHHEILVNLVNPHFIDPNIEDVNLVNYPDLENSAIENATFALAPGEEATVALRIIRENGSGISTAEAVRAAEEFTENVGVGVTSHAVNTGQTGYPISTTPVQIFTFSLPNGVIDTPYASYIHDDKHYNNYIKIFGGTPLSSYSIISGALPYDLGLNYPSPDDYTIGIAGTPQFDSGVTYPHPYDFTIQVVASNGVDIDTQDLS
ncbi:MAG: pentapeptide repeat-containing protein, partial [Thermoplasmata archaeon]